MCSKEQKRRSAKFKTEVVLSLLCGESAEELSRKHGVTMADIAQWRDEFIAYGTQGFKKNPEDSKPPGLFAVRKGLEPSRYARSACCPKPPVKPDGLTSPLGNGGRGLVLKCSICGTSHLHAKSLELLQGFLRCGRDSNPRPPA